MNADLMVGYIKLVADRLLVELECEKLYWLYWVGVNRHGTGCDTARNNMI